MGSHGWGPLPATEAPVATLVALLPFLFRVSREVRVLQTPFLGGVDSFVMGIPPMRAYIWELTMLNAP